MGGKPIKGGGLKPAPSVGEAPIEAEDAHALRLGLFGAHGGGKSILFTQAEIIFLKSTIIEEEHRDWMFSSLLQAGRDLLSEAHKSAPPFHSRRDGFNNLAK